MKFIKLFLFIIGMGLVQQAQAGITPIALSLIPPVELPPRDFTIAGVRVDLLWGDHHNVYGLDVGTIMNSTLQNSAGIQVVGGANVNHGTTHIIGLQLAGIANINEQHMTGLGAQIALYNGNMGESSFVGVQLGAVNNSGHTKVYGLDVGLYNKALEVYGFQIGLINSAGDLHGLQIGLLNFNDRGLFSVCPILNVGF